MHLLSATEVSPEGQKRGPKAKRWGDVIESAERTKETAGSNAELLMLK